MRANTRFATFQYGYKKTGRFDLPIGEKGIWPTAFPFCSPQGPLQICGSLKRSLCFLFFFVSLLSLMQTRGLQRFSIDTKKPEDFNLLWMRERDLACGIPFLLAAGALANLRKPKEVAMCFLFFFVSLLHLCKQGLQRFSMDTKKGMTNKVISFFIYI